MGFICWGLRHRKRCEKVWGTMNKINYSGINEDILGKVDISKIFGGYFSNPKNAQAFVDVGIKPILTSLPSSIKYADFGGGDGYLGKYVTDFLISNGKEVESTVIDANPRFLAKAKKLGLKVLLVNLQEVKFPNLDLITMRAVTHYNPFDVQLEILKKVYNNLKNGGYLLSQLSTGNQANCTLRNLIKNYELNLDGKQNSYEWITVKKYLHALKITKFSQIKLMGYAPPGSWTLEEQWERVNSVKRATALTLRRLDEVKSIDEKKEKFFAKAKQLINLEKYKSAGIEKTETGDYRVPYQYAIILAKK